MELSVQTCIDITKEGLNVVSTVVKVLNKGQLHSENLTLFPLVVKQKEKP